MRDYKALEQIIVLRNRCNDLERYLALTDAILTEERERNKVLGGQVTQVVEANHLMVDRIERIENWIGKVLKGLK